MLHKTKFKDGRILRLDDIHRINELEQVKYCLRELNKILNKTARELGKSKEELEKELFEEFHRSRELEQEKILLSEVVDSKFNEKYRLHKKYYLSVALAAIILAAVVSFYSIYVVEISEQDYKIDIVGQIKSGYIIQNLRGDTIDTWLSWRLVRGDTLHISIVNSVNYPDKIEIIKNAIQSTESIEIDDSLFHKGPPGVTSTYYLGWKGALEEAAGTPTKFFIPKNLEVLESDSGEGDIIITLTDQRSGDGYSGYTKSIADETQNQILKSQITIFEVSSLNDNQLSTIVRHEFGHALGLAHSTAPENLMHPIIETGIPYISECNIAAIISLYDGNESSQVVCEK